MTMSIIQVLLRPGDILNSASCLPPTGPGFHQDLIAQSDMLMVLTETTADGCQMTYEYRLFRLRRLLGVEKISCAHQNEPERKKKSLAAAARRAPAATPRPVSLLTALGDARRICRGRGVVMAGTAGTESDDLEYAINTINKLTALVDRTGYGDEPEEADEAQRQGHEAIRRLRLLKTTPKAADGGGQPAERTGDAMAA
jgi:hypothetical protein